MTLHTICVIAPLNNSTCRAAVTNNKIKTNMIQKFDQKLHLHYQLHPKKQYKKSCILSPKDDFCVNLKLCKDNKSLLFDCVELNLPNAYNLILEVCHNTICLVKQPCGWQEVGRFSFTLLFDYTYTYDLWVWCDQLSQNSL